MKHVTVPVKKKSEVSKYSKKNLILRPFGVLSKGGLIMKGIQGTENEGKNILQQANKVFNRELSLKFT